MQSLSLQGTKKECHDPQKKYEQLDVKGRPMNNEAQVIQPVQVEFSKVIDDQMNFEKTKKDQFRDYKNMVVHDQGREDSRFKVQKRSVYTQPGLTSANQPAAIPSSRQPPVQKMPTNDLADDHFLIKSSKINFQDQLARRQGDLDHYRKSLDL